ncbi:MAG: ABC transporter substrate-binding protein [Actinomycetes bacterium]
MSRFPRTALLLSVVVFATACAGDGPADGSTDATGATTASGDPTPLTFVLFGGPEEVAGYQAMVDAFEAENPDVDVTLSPVPDQTELLARLTTGFAGGQPPEVFLINFRKYGQFAGQGALRPVQSYLDASEVLSVEDFAQPPLDAFRFDGEELTCLPQNVSSLVGYVNLDRFAAAGVEVPRDGWDWDELVATGTALTDADAGVWGVGMEASLIRLAPFVWSNGGEVVDDERAPTALTLGDGAAREALDFFVDLQLVHGIVPPDADEQSRGARDRFLDGDLGVYFDSRKVVPEFRTITGFEWDVVPVPVAPGGEAVTILHSDAYCIAEGTGREDAAWRLVEFAAGVEAQEILAESGRTVPSRLDVLTSPVFLEPDQPPASAQVFVDNAEIARATPTSAEWAQVEKLGDDLLADVFYGRVDREEGIARLLEQTAPLFRRAGG